MAVLTKITGRSLADNAVSSSHVQADTLAAGDIAAGSVGSSELADDAVGAAQLASNAVVDASVASGAAIGLNKLATTGALSATSLALTGTITGNPKATNATTVAATYANEQERVHGTNFTTTGSTITGDVVFESLTDDTVTLSGTGTITGSGGKVTIKGLKKEEYVSKSGGGFTGMIHAPNINVGGATVGDLSVGNLSNVNWGSDVTFPSGHIIQIKYFFTRNAYNELSKGSNEDWSLMNGEFLVNITPKQSDSSFIINVRWNGWSEAPRDCGMNLHRDGRAIHQGTGNNMNNNFITPINVTSPYGYSGGTPGDNIMSCQYQVHDPQGSIAGVPIIYQVMFNTEGYNKEVRTNRNKSGGTDESASCEMSVMEVSGEITL
jgi:hypothetical protein